MSIPQWMQAIHPAPPANAASSEMSEPLLSVSTAWSSLRRRTGIPLARATFYRWVGSGKVYSMRLGLKVYIPASVIDGIVKQCRGGETLWPLDD